MRSFVSIRLSSLALALAAASAFAQAVPTRVTFTGRIVDSGAPVQGSRDFVFKLFPTIVGGTEVWTETRNGVTVVDGAVNLDLGASTPLTPAILDGQILYLEVTVGTQVLTPRTPVLSVPYAVRSTVASQVGSLTAAQLQQRVASACGAGAAIQAINADGTVVCQAVGANDAGVTTITSITAGSGLTGGGSTGNVNLAANFAGSGTANTVSRSDHNHTGTYLPLGPVLACTGTDKVVGIAANGSVICAVDSSNTYGVLSNGGLALNGSNQFSLATCPTAGHVYKMVGGVWTCAPDADSPPTGNAPISVTGNAVSLTTCPNAGDILKMSGGTWRCMTDDNTVGVTAVNVSGVLTSTGGSTPTLGLGVIPLSLGGAGTSLATTGGPRQFVKQSAAGATLSVGVIATGDLPSHQHPAGDITGVLPVANGGTGAALSSSGGPGQVVKQLTAGGPLSVGAITASELPATVQNWATQPACPVQGQVIRGIASDGTPTCVAMPPPPVWGGIYSGYCSTYPCSIAVPQTYAHGSSSGTVTVTHPSTGNYNVTFPWINQGIPQVSVYNTSNINCRIASWGVGPMSVNVSCMTSSGTMTDTLFNLTVHGI